MPLMKELHKLHQTASSDELFHARLHCWNILALVSDKNIPEEFKWKAKINTGAEGSVV